MRRAMRWAFLFAALCGGAEPATADEKDALDAYERGDFFDVLSACRPKAEAGNPTCQNLMGTLYMEGKGVKADPTEAVRWFWRAAEQGNDLAAVNLGSAYEKGRGIGKDLGEAEKWYREAAEDGLAEGQFRLGILLADTQKDMAQSVKWLQPAAQQGFSPAQLALGLAYELGDSLERDYVLAARWYEAAAEHGESGAQSRLAALYERGLGVEPDPAKAFFWYWVALTDPHNPDMTPDAQALKRVTLRLSESQIAEAKTAARSWHPKPTGTR